LFTFFIEQVHSMSLNNVSQQGCIRRPIRNFLWGVALIAGAAVLLINCGGNGGGAGSGTKSDAGETLNQGLSGRLWQPDIAVGSLHYITDADTGNTIRTGSKLYDNLVSVARDSRLFVSQNISALSDTTVVTIHPVPTTQIALVNAPNLGTLSFSSTINEVAISPDSRYLALIYANDTRTAATKNGLYIYDLQNQASVNSVSPKRIHDTGMSSTQISRFGWLPGGEYRYVYLDNRIMAGSVANPSQPDKFAGKIVAPVGYQTSSDFAVSPDGEKIATSFRKEPQLGVPDDPREVWLTDITGGNPQQLTAGEDAITPVWSPDGQFISVASGRVGRNNDRSAYVCKRKYISSAARKVIDDANRKQIRYIPYRKLLVDSMYCPPIDLYWTE
jgi:hypothetical protein